MVIRQSITQHAYCKVNLFTSSNTLVPKNFIFLLCLNTFVQHQKQELKLLREKTRNDCHVSLEALTMKIFTRFLRPLTKFQDLEKLILKRLKGSI